MSSCCYTYIIVQQQVVSLVYIVNEWLSTRELNFVTVVFANMMILIAHVCRGLPINAHATKTMYRNRWPCSDEVPGTQSTPASEIVHGSEYTDAFDGSFET